MPTLTIIVSDQDAAELASYARQMNLNRSQVMRAWIYRYAYAPNTSIKSYPAFLDIEDDLARAVDKIVIAHNKREGHDIGGWKFSDAINRLVRRGIADMISKGDREP